MKSKKALKFKNSNFKKNFLNNSKVVEFVRETYNDFWDILII
jgi:hypothetical protein